MHTIQSEWETFRNSAMPNNSDEIQWRYIYYAGAMGALKILEDIARFDDSVGVVILEGLQRQCDNFFSEDAECKI